METYRFYYRREQRHYFEIQAEAFTLPAQRTNE